MGKLDTLQAAENLNTEQALEWLKSQGIHTSRSGLDHARKTGRLSWLKVSGKTRILYRRDDLAAAFFEGIKTCPSNSSSGTAPAITTSGAALPEQKFMQALTQATGKRRKTSGSGRKPNCSNVHRLGAKRP
ncbi:hypothetical protein [Tritonibacter mobilis]|uniref:hypothetical protein n=1 Tax=Tritonibacter mobilis TaxID=379347 RepID=UPI0013A65B4A|nr:hypothetical protein [Tritonibacter mobilis]